VTHAVENPDSVGMSARRLERVRPAMQAYVDRGVYAGLSTLIARRGRIVHSEQFGWRDKEAQAPTSADWTGTGQRAARGFAKGSTEGTGARRAEAVYAGSRTMQVHPRSGPRVASILY
jgi:hypothetical protein